MDICLASTDARFGFVFTRRGIVPECGASWFLLRILGIGTALYWCMSGPIFPAEEALAESGSRPCTPRSADAAEGVASFLEKRAPAYPDRVSSDLPDFFPWQAEPPFRVAQGPVALASAARAPSSAQRPLYFVITLDRLWR